MSVNARGRGASSRRGSSALEFALVTPLLMLLTFAIMDWSWFLVEYQFVTRAAQVGARGGAQTRLADGPTTVAQARARAYLESASLVPTGAANYTTPLTCSAVDNSMIRVQVSVPFAPLVGFVPMPSTVRASTTMRCEDVP